MLHFTHFKRRNTRNTLRISRGVIHVTHFKTRNTCNALRISIGVIHVTLYPFQEV